MQQTFIYKFPPIITEGEENNMLREINKKAALSVVIILIIGVFLTPSINSYSIKNNLLFDTITYDVYFGIENPPQKDDKKSNHYSDPYPVQSQPYQIPSDPAGWGRGRYRLQE